MQWSGGIDQTFGQDWRISAKYVGTRSVKMFYSDPPNAFQTYCAGCFVDYAFNAPVDPRFGTVLTYKTGAGKGVVVLQIEGHRESQGTPDEIHAEVAAYEGGIDYLDHLDLIDRNRVEIMAFSRTGLGVKYVLTHSEYRSAAATLADTTNHSYFAYLSILNSLPSFGADAEGTNGRPPFGEGLASWLKNAAGFNLYRVKTPVRLEAHSRGSLLGEWEWFASLWRSGEPVELVLIPDATHVPAKPWERMVSQQGDVDWFCFWLKHEEDSDPAKAEQYTRWRELKKMQGENDKKALAGNSSN